MRRHVLRVVIMLVAVIVVFALYRRLTIQPPTPTAYLQLGRPMNMAHRGGSALAPENTMLAFQTALSLGADVIELDVHASADGELVVIHDETVDRTTDGQGLVSQMTLAELKKLDAGYRYTLDNGATFPYRGKGLQIPTLREVLEAFPDARVNIEIKQTDPPIEEALAALIRELNAEERVLVVAQDDGAIKRFRRLAHGVATGASTGEVRTFYLFQRAGLASLYRPVAHALQVPLRSGGTELVTPAFVEAAHKQGMQVHVWTINLPGDMRRLLDMGVDGIITDRPDLLRQVMAEAGF